MDVLKFRLLCPRPVAELHDYLQGGRKESLVALRWMKAAVSGSTRPGQFR